MILQLYQFKLLKKLQKEKRRLRLACIKAYRALILDSDMEEDFAPEIRALKKALNW